MDISNLIVENDDNSIYKMSVEDHDQYYEENNSNVFLMNLAHFVLKLEFKFSLPASTVQYIAAELCQMTKKNEELMKNNLSINLKQYNIPAD